MKTSDIKAGEDYTVGSYLTCCTVLETGLRDIHSGTNSGVQVRHVARGHTFLTTSRSIIRPWVEHEKIKAELSARKKQEDESVALCYKQRAEAAWGAQVLLDGALPVREWHVPPECFEAVRAAGFAQGSNKIRFLAPFNLGEAVYNGMYDERVVAALVVAAWNNGNAAGLKTSCEDAPECECAMTESSFRACPPHGETATCPDCGAAWLDHSSTPTEETP